MHRKYTEKKKINKILINNLNKSLVKDKIKERQIN